MNTTPTGDRGRRTFIKTVVLSTGAVFLDWGRPAEAASGGLIPILSALDYKTAHSYLRDAKSSVVTGTPKDAADVIVIGGGLSGLAAAWTIIKHGKSVMVIDNEPAVGGAVRAAMIGDIQTEIGATRFAKTAGPLGEIISDCGLTPVRIPGDGYWVDGSTMLRDLYSEKNLRENTMLSGSPVAIRNFRQFFLATDPMPSLPLFSAAPEVIALYDQMESKDIPGSQSGAELADWLDVFSLATFGRTFAKLNPYVFFATYGPQMGETFDMPWYTFDGGMSALPIAMANKIGADRIRSRTLAARVENIKKGVHVTTVGPAGTQTLASRAAVVATQKRIASRLVADLPGVQQYRMKMLPLAPMVNVQLRCSKPLFRNRAFVVWFRDPNRRFFNIHDATYMRDMQAGTLDRTTGEFVYTVPCIPTDTSIQSLEKEEWLVEFAQKTIGAVSEYVPEAFNLTTELRIFAWGHAIVSPQPGMMGQFYPHMSESFGQIFFAGSDNDVCSTIEGAVGHGVRAAEEALKNL